MSSLSADKAPTKKSFAQVAAAARSSGIAPKNSEPSQITKNVQKDNRLGTASQIHHEALEPGSDPVVAPKSQNLAITPNITAAELSSTLNAVTLEDGQTFATASDNSGKRENSDTKSMTSRTTLTLDEKESLRPDDSASTRAPQEEDALSPGGSVVAGSKPDSDRDDRAFRNQLNEIDKTGNKIVLAQRNSRDPSQGQPHPIEVEQRPMQVSLDPNQMLQSSGPLLHGSSPGLLVPPDEKLIEALASPKDRLFVLKVEQDMIDFIKDSKEQYLQLPQTNSFYRMLSHKLADYYFLGHYIDDSLTSVRIHRTPYARLPPPLIGLDSVANGSTTPPTGIARKIMKRAGTNNIGQQALNGQDIGLLSPMPSKPSSENGLGSGSEDIKDAASQSVDKTTLSREERETRYNEARARIFAGFKEQAESTESSSAANEVEMSRSSSASGAKKGKKNRKQNDDGFEARSAYSQYNGQAFPINGMQQAQAQQQGFVTFATANPHIPSNFPYDMQAGQPSLQHMPNTWNNQPPYPYGMAVDYNSMQQNSVDTNMMHMSSYPPFHGFQTQNMAAQAGPNGQTYGQQPDTSFWSQQSFYPQFGMNGNGSGAISAAHPGHFMYAYPPYDGHASNAYNQQQFNPASQAFTPSFRGAPMAAANPSFMSGSAGYAVHSPFQRTPSGSTQISGVNTTPSKKNQNNSSQSPNTPAQSQNGRTATSISKWGTPPTLPPKPPPTATSLAFQAPRHSDSQQPLPQNPMAGLGIQRGQQNGAPRSHGLR